MLTNLFSIVLASVFVMPAFAATPANQGRRTMSNQMAPRVSQVAMSSAKAPVPTTQNHPTTTNVSEEPDVVIDTRDKERLACLSNNIGTGDTFVWASRYSNTNNYATMVEDTENPENNTCFVRVELKSTDPKIKLSDIPAQYFEMGRTITCGAWTNEENLKTRILDAKKSARVGGVVGAVVGGAALGVGAMELFGNKLIGGKVEGQKALSGNELYRSQLLVLKKENPSRYSEIITQLKELQKNCDDDAIKNLNPDYCNKYNYTYLLSVETLDK